MEDLAMNRAGSAIPLQPHLLSRALRLTGNDADARDLVQDTMEKVLRTSSTPSNETELRRWLRCVMTNLWIDRVRARKARRHLTYCDQQIVPEEIRGTPDPTDEDESWRDLSLSDVASALQEVPEPFRSAFQGHALERQSYATLAREMGIRPSTVGTRVLRARGHLRSILEKRLCDSRISTRRGELNVHRNVF